jgi:two-component system sensor kinase FixL
MEIVVPSLAVIMETSLDGVVATDEYGAIIGWNRNAESIFGHTADEAMRQPMADLIIPPDTRSAHIHGMNRYITTGVVHILGKRVIVTALHKTGHEFPIELAVMITSKVGNKCFIAFIRDLTAETAAKEKIQMLQNELLHLNRLNAMGTAAAMIAHELNQPLAAATNYLSGCQKLAQNLGGPSNKDFQFAINNAKEAIKAAVGIVKEVRSIVSHQPIERSDNDLKELMINAVRLIGGSLPSKPIYRLGLSAKIVSVNKGEIEQVLLNLVKNAAEAIKDRPDPIIICSSKRVGNMVEVCVRDNGAGLSPNAHANLFTALKSEKEDGLGLGLSICRAIVEQGGGDIWVQSDDSGTAVTFTVAAAETA